MRLFKLELVSTIPFSWLYEALFSCSRLLVEFSKVIPLAPFCNALLPVRLEFVAFERINPEPLFPNAVSFVRFVPITSKIPKPDLVL